MVMPRFRKILIGLLLALFATYYCETTCFVHSHVSDSGIVTHSHPYLPGASHGHTTVELQALTLLTAVVFTAIVLGHILRPSRMLLRIVGQCAGRPAISSHIKIDRIRGPTDFICI